MSPATIHLTVTFLGTVPDERVVDVGDALAAVAAASRPLRLRLAGGGAFPRRGPARVLWVGVAGDVDPLGVLAKAIDEALVPFGFEAESRGYHPHVTLGRVKRGNPREAVQRLRALGDLGEIPAAELILFASDTRPEGAVHTPIRRLPLGPDLG